MMILTEIAGDDQEKPDSRMKAIDLLNKMDGEYINKLELTQPIDNSIKEMEGILLALFNRIAVCSV